MELSQGTAPFTGTFKSRSALSAFNGAEATGNWTITINDMVPANDGVFEAWSISILSTSATGIQNINQPPSDFELSQNYPNPFNPSTKISWQSPVGSHQTLKVYDLLGNEVASFS